MGFLLLGIDSLIACVAVGAVVGKKSRLSFAACFGLADGLGFLLGAALHFTMPELIATFVETGVLLSLGVYWIVLALATKRMSGTKWVWILPWVLCIDNITYGLIDHAWSRSVWAQAGEQALSSALLALAGIVVSVAAVRAVPRALAAVQRRRDEASLGGGATVVAGGGLAFDGAFGLSAGAVAGMVAGVALIAAAFVELVVG